MKFGINYNNKNFGKKNGVAPILRLKRYQLIFFLSLLILYEGIISVKAEEIFIGVLGVMSGPAAQRGVRHIDTIDFDSTYFQNNFSNARELLRNMIKQHPDFIVFPGVLPNDLPKLIKLAREQGFSGLLGATAAHEPDRLIAIGKAANGLFYLGGNPAKDSWSEYKQKFVRRYIASAGEWHDEAGTKSYALEILLRTLQKAGQKAIDEVEVFKKVMDNFTTPDPFIKTPREMRFLDPADFGQSRQINVPLIINTIQDGKVKTVHISQLNQ